MTARLALISLLALISFLPCRAADDSTESDEYNMLMQVRGMEITSICVMETAADGSIVGTVVNEFGIKAFDFTFANGKAKVFNVIGPLNKWYIRKVLKGDFTFLLSNMKKSGNVKKKKRRLTVTPDGDIVMRNDRFKISYTLSPMDSKE